jgi:hypothetical protein
MNKLSWWKILLICIGVLFLISVVVTLFPSFSQSRYNGTDEMYKSQQSMDYMPTMKYNSAESFVPDAEDRVVIETASLGLEVEDETQFDTATMTVENLVNSTDSYILNQNITLKSKTRNDKKDYYLGTYVLRVNATNYAYVFSELKNLGKITSLNQNKEDVTGEVSSTDDKISSKTGEILDLRSDMYDTNNTASKKVIENKIIQLEKDIRDLQNQISIQEENADYVRINLTICEKHLASKVASNDFLSVLIGSFKVLAYIILVLLPWAVIAFITYLIIKRNKSKKAKLKK